MLKQNKEIRLREKELRNFFGVKHVFFVSSGKAALYIILEALKALHPGKDEVVIPAYTCFSVPSAVVKAGLKVTPCDIDPITFDFHLPMLENTFNKNTLCVIPNHLFGIPSDMASIMSIAKKKDVVVVEDAAQAMGGVLNDRRLGTAGDVGFFSFGRGKNVTCGSGGGIVTNSDTIGVEMQNIYSRTPSPKLHKEIIEFIKIALLKFLINPNLFWIPTAIPALKLGETIFYKNFPIEKLSGMRAGIMKRWEKRLSNSNASRRGNSEWFMNHCRLDCVIMEGKSPLRFPILMDSIEARDGIYSESKKMGLGLSKLYPVPVSDIEELKGMMDNTQYPGARVVSERLICLPVHELVSGRDRGKICHLLDTHGVLQMKQAGR